MTLDILVLAIVAVFFGVRLFLVLGQKSDDGAKDDGKESIINRLKQRFEKTSEGETERMEEELTSSSQAFRDRILDVEARKVSSPELPPPPELFPEAWQRLVRSDPSFTWESFLEGAERVYGLVLEHFRDADKDALRALTNDEVYEAFAEEIDRRRQTKQYLELTLVGIEKMTLEDVKEEEGFVRATVVYETAQIVALCDANGQVLEGNPKKTIQITDRWTYEKEVDTPDPNWCLIETGR